MSARLKYTCLFGLVVGMAFGVFRLVSHRAEQAVSVTAQGTYPVGLDTIYVAPAPGAAYPGAYSVTEMMNAGFTVVSDTVTLRAVVDGLDEPPAALVFHRSQFATVSPSWLFAQAVTGTIIGGVNLADAEIADTLGISGTALSPVPSGPSDYVGGGTRPDPAVRDFWSWVAFDTDGPINSPAGFTIDSMTCFTSLWEWQYLTPEQYRFRLIDGTCARPVPTPDYPPMEVVTPPAASG